MIVLPVLVVLVVLAAVRRAALPYRMGGRHYNPYGDGYRWGGWHGLRRRRRPGHLLLVLLVLAALSAVFGGHHHHRWL